MYDRMRVCPQGCGVAMLLHPAQSYTGCTVVILCTIKKKGQAKSRKADIRIGDITQQMSHCFVLCGLTQLPVISACHEDKQL